MDTIVNIMGVLALAGVGYVGFLWCRWNWRRGVKRGRDSYTRKHRT